MATIKVIEDHEQLVDLASRLTINILKNSLEQSGAAVWVLAGGRLPEKAYPVVANKYSEGLDWSKVTLAVGDERCVPLTSPDSNWGMVKSLMLSSPSIDKSKKLIPETDLKPAEMASNYEQQLNSIAGIDCLWLGMGEDGHTLSLFPGQASLNETSKLVLPVYDSPKPPAERITLALKALENVKHCLIMVATASKEKVLARAIDNDSSLPIVLAINTIEAHGGTVTWLIDKPI